MYIIFDVVSIYLTRYYLTISRFFLFIKVLPALFAVEYIFLFIFLLTHHGSPHVPVFSFEECICNLGNGPGILRSNMQACMDARAVFSFLLESDSNLQ